jgi:hypothetical protein
MSKKILDLGFLSDNLIIEKVEQLGEALMTETAHNFEKYGRIKIIDVATQSANSYSEQAQSLPAIALIEVILAAHRNYNLQVLRHINRLKKGYPFLKSFEDLNVLLALKTKPEFFEIWGHKDTTKYDILVNILKSVDNLKLAKPNLTDYQIMNDWAKNININDYKKDSIGEIIDVGLATVQHLRMTFGANTVKPDQRVTEVLNHEFGLSQLSQSQSITVVEYISNVTNKPALLIDQIFVLYGSGYYNRNGKIDPSANILNTVLAIAKKLKVHNVEPDIISKSTNLTLQQISEL